MIPNIQLKIKWYYLIILFTNLTSAQEQSKKEFNSIVTLSALSPTFNFAPRWNLGYIKKIDKRYWAGIEVGYGNKDIAVNFAKESRIKDDFKIFEIKPEFYYQLNPESKLRHLLSLEIQYLKHTDKFENTWYYNLDNEVYYKFASADYKRIKYGININHNLIYNITENLALMQKVGIGFRKRNVTYSNVINRTEDWGFEETGFIVRTDGYLVDNGICNSFNFNLDLKIIYKF
ncbi:hypothetical protein [Flavobacterium microcysteis]|jgi:hypothetical protein|uniref:Uncharacterized protein n=1 Tax=Flavobacterium microcysteis TaxID=2596891 RepID=A0A501Q455_9FLAO|nr:hypothetical protein [Flavobacterium microcysteis]TPD66997.1 hypothetical protein FJA49_12000 [Flavobacterium microcysteis]